MIETGVAAFVLKTPVHTVAGQASASDETLALFERYGQSIYRFARVTVAGVQNAEDIVQTTFLRLLDHLARDGDRSNLKGWLFTVAANLCRDHARHQRRWLSWLPQHDALMRTEPDLEMRGPHDLFLAIVRTLPKRDRLLLALRAQGLSYRDIAEASGVRVTSVGRLLARALARWHEARAAASSS
jgi:RNA polymerase sigma-70 factor (ECF subfamily)